MALGWPIAIEQQVGRSYGVSPDGVGFNAPSSMVSWYSSYGAEKTQTGRSLREYIQRVRRHVHEAFRVLKPGGVAAYALANSIRAQKEFDLVGGFVEIAEEAGFSSVDVVRRQITKRRILPAGRNLTTGRFSSDAVPGIDERLIFARR
jgi:hypothetical protein